MAEVNLNINGRNYGIACDAGQEKRVKELGYYIDQRIKEISRAGAASNDSHLLILTALMLADEIFDQRDELSDLAEKAQENEEIREEDALMVRAIDHLADRIDLVAGRIAKA
jgi:cell division protein ZapA